MTSSSAATRPSIGRDLLELLASMRFAITLLSVICIASVIGTVIKQHEPQGNYVNQFGPFWAELFGRLDLYTVYSAPWFLVILAFLVVSTSLCIARNAPKIAADLRSYKEGVREQSLQAHHHKAIGELPSNPEIALAETGKLLTALGWKARVQKRDNGIMIAARRGAANKLGYLAAHSAIVLVCLGGLFDGDLMVKLMMWAQGKQLYTGSGMVADVRPEHRLASSNPSFRGNLFVPEGSRAGTAVLTLPGGIVLQDLPFDVELKKFSVDYYPTGMPKSFASDIVIHDGPQATPVTVKVNEPAIYKGLAIYQSSFEDGGSKLQIQAIPLAGQAGVPPLKIEGRVGSKQAFGEQTLELDGLRVINVENLAGSANASGADVRKVDLGERFSKHLGSGAKGDKDKSLHNVGPSFSYKLRDAAGQAREYNNYMLPVELDGQKVFLAGVRDSPAENFRYLRIPADENGELAGWLRLRQALADAGQRDAAAKAYAASAAPGQMAPQLELTAQRALALFAGVAAPGRSSDVKGGLPALSQFIESSVPESERQRVSEVLLRVLNGSLFELYQLAREHDRLKPAATDAATQAFMTQAVLSLSDSFYYPSPMLLRLQGFEQVQASVFQVARAPGQKLVYLGAVLLIIGVFAMLYIKERRLWIWITPSSEPGGSQLRMAMSSTRESPDNATLFTQLKAAVLKEPS